MSQQQVQQPKEEDKEKQAYDDAIAELVRLAQEEEESEIGQFKKRLRKLGIVIADAYHCNRCNYVWFPRDFAIHVTDYYSDDKLTERIPPKACARCKSKYWNLPPKRKSKHVHTYLDETYHDMCTSKRLQAYYRVLLRDIAEQDKRIKHLEELAKKRGIELKE